MAATSVVLILEVDPRIGTSVAEKFVNTGYKAAVVSRKGTTTFKNILSIHTDFAKPDSIPALFEAVKIEIHVAPSVVVYTAASLTPAPDNGSVLSTSAERVEADLNVNVLGAYVAAQQAVKGRETLPKEAKKTFIYTDNITNVAILPMPITLTLGTGKSASAYWFGTADALYSAQGYRFFYADERHGNGKFKGTGLGGVAYAEFFADLVEYDGTVS